MDRRLRAVTLICLVACGAMLAVRSVPAQTLTLVFQSYELAPEPDLVRMAQGLVDDGTVVIDIRIGGPTTSREYHTFLFEILIADPAVVAFVAGSGRPGTFLTPPVSVRATPAADRVVVAVSTLGQVGRGTDEVEEVVLSLTFRAVSEGTTELSFLGSRSLAEGPVALDVNGQVITTTRFGTGGLLTVSHRPPVPAPADEDTPPE